MEIPHMNSMLRRLVAVGAAAFVLAGCSKISPLSAPALKSGSADFSVVASLGTGYSAGFQSNGLVAAHQQKAFPYLFAQHVGAASYTIPGISADGIPPLLQIVSLKPLIINNVGRTLGAPTNIAQPFAYHDMAIPGAALFDVGDSSAYHTAPNPVGRVNFTFFNLIQRTRGTLLGQVASLAPTFITFEFGVDEMLGPVMTGTSSTVLPSATFGALLTGTLNGVGALAPNAKVAICNVPDVTSLPFVTTFPPFVLDANGNPVIVLGSPLTLIGSEGGPTAPLGPGDHVLLTAGDSLAIGTGFPIGTLSFLTGAPGNGRPLPDAMVLSAAEAATIQAQVTGYNTSIATEAAARGMALVDLNALFHQAATTGISYQGTTYTNAFVTGGLFSLDGVDPNDFMQGVMCNTMIDAVNRQFGATISPLNLATVGTPSSSRARPSGNGAALPWIQSDGTASALFPWRASEPR
jgi:hypothetical protein